jgi:hypothetical protein
VPGLQFSLRIAFSRLPVSKVMGWYPLVEEIQKLKVTSITSTGDSKRRHKFSLLLADWWFFVTNLLENSGGKL